MNLCVLEDDKKIKEKKPLTSRKKSIITWYYKTGGE